MIFAGLGVIWASDLNKDFNFDRPADVVTRMYLAMRQMERVVPDASLIIPSED